ncbi:MAG: glycerophosphodiester phosphodiesterase [Duncaniella sp.]|nr:glycerophosphodiester phosphodiesterase [Duncaniella sp.]
MKKFLIIAAAAIAGTISASAATPQLIGRRGSAYGVENSKEAFRNGARMGFDMMECHVRLTADSVYVAAHDGKTARLGGDMKIESSTLPQLLTETYTQTIDGNTYSGRLLTVADYLEFCRDNGKTPLLHLKTMAKKDTDLSPLPGLVELIDSLNLRDECVILTASKSYADYFLNSAPGLKVVFQADGKWRELAPWIIERNLDVDIKQDFIDQECIDTFHGAGLKIMTWTVNTIDDYLRLANLGVDQMITDYLSPRTQP